MRVKKGDTVLVIAGKDRGKQGLVEKALPATGQVVVAGANIRKRHFRASSTRPTGGIVEYPAALDRAKVMLVCPQCSKPTRVHMSVTGDTKHRACAKCGANLDAK
jgi:large subunit ribosomal protein L24